MYVFLTLLIPVVITAIFYYYYKHEYTWWEFFVPILSVLAGILIAKALVSHNMVMFEEYWGSSVTNVVEHEPYNYWQEETCSYTTTDGKGNSTTHYYDCSHQVDVAPKWVAHTDIGESFEISERQHDALVKQFENNRRLIKTIENHDADDEAVDSRGTKYAGKDVGKYSRVYQTNWNGKDETRKAFTSRHSYVNKIKASDLTIFNIKIVDKEKADSMGLFEYPPCVNGGMFGKTNGLEVPTILGKNIPENIREQFRRLNGKFGVSNQMRLWVLVFDDKPSITGNYQENYWVRGNMNELVICVGRKGNKIQWAHAFSWAKSDALTAKVENLVLNLYTYKDSTYTKQLPILPISVVLKKKLHMKHKVPVLPITVKNQDTTVKVKSEFPTLNAQTWNTLYVELNKNLKTFKRRSFKEFDYLSIELKPWAYWLIIILALGISIGTNIWAIMNDIYDGSNGDRSDDNNYYRRY